MYNNPKSRKTYQNQEYMIYGIAILNELTDQSGFKALRSKKLILELI
jgi:hypothetical protein